MHKLNANKTERWKADVERSIDYYNDWFLRFAPETYRAQRSVTSVAVARALEVTFDLRSVTPAVLREHPGILPILRMACAPPIARDRLVGLAHLNKNLVLSMGGGGSSDPRLPLRMIDSSLDEQLQRICDTIEELVDRDLLTWLGRDEQPDNDTQQRAALVIADRLCGAAADPIVRNAQEQRQLAALGRWLDSHGYRQITTGAIPALRAMEPGTYTFRMNVTVDKGRRRVLIPVDCVVQPLNQHSGDLPVLIEAKSAGDATNTNKRRKEEAQKYRQLSAQLGDELVYLLLLCGYFETGYLGYEAAEGIDWVWEHRLADPEPLLGPRASDALRLNEPDAPTYAAAAPQRETLRLAAQQAVDGERSQLSRNRLGQFSTPYALASQIVEAALTHYDFGARGPLRFLEPALGSGVFFSALERLVDRSLIARATGIEVDPGYAQVAERLWPDAPFHVLGGADYIDFSLNADRQPPAAFNLLCTNPPYVRHHHLPPELKMTLQQVIKQTLQLRPSGLSGLYVYFVLLAHHLLAPDAVASWLIPAEFMAVNYGRVLRDYLLTRVTLKRIHQFDPAAVQFEDALVSSCVVTYVRKRPAPDDTFIYSYGGTLAEPHEQRPVALGSISGSQKWLLRPTSAHAARQFTDLTFGDLFAVKRGVATGSNAFFLLDAETVRTYAIPAQFLRPILPSPRHLKAEIIHSDADGYPQHAGARWLLDCDREPADIAANYPGLWRYLQSGIAQGVDQGYLCSSRKIWYQQEKRDPALFMATYMARSRSAARNPFRFFLNLSQAIGTNVFLLLYPKPHVLAAIAGSAARQRELLALLNGLASEDVVSRGRTYGGGLHKLEPKEMAMLRLAHVPDWLDVPRQLSLAADWP